jgi:hypothetical protein
MPLPFLFKTSRSGKKEKKNRTTNVRLDFAKEPPKWVTRATDAGGTCMKLFLPEEIKKSAGLSE